ncbi:hypothetical protein [Sphingorhabdus buctiana]|uniref:hypothetical protein n=1 Tax=Sphingorhabdus buctiana TaxID=1508805 RepID=UPI0036D42F90
MMWPRCPDAGYFIHAGVSCTGSGKAGVLSNALYCGGEEIGGGGHWLGAVACGGGSANRFGFRRKRRAKNPNGHYLRDSGDGE